MMRAMFGVVGLLVVVLVVGLLAKKQLTAGVAPATGVTLPGAAPGRPATPQQQVQQFQQAVQGAVQQARPMPEDEK